MRKPPPGAPEGETRRDRRLLALLAMGVLLVGVAVGVELCRRLFARASPGTLAGDYEFRLPPAAVKELPPEPAAPPSPVRTMSAAKFLTTLAKKTPRPVARKFVSAFAQRPRLRQVFKDATRKGLDKTPAPDLIRALMAAPEFREIVMESRSDPGFREAFSQLAGDPELGSTLRAGTISLVRGPESILPATPVTGNLPAERGAEPYSGAPPPRSLDEAPEAEVSSGEEERQERQAGDEAHAVVPLKRIESVKSDRTARSYLSSVFVGMAREHREKLEALCDKFGDTMGCHPKQLCDWAELMPECKQACARSPKCPKNIFTSADTYDEPDPG